MKMLFLKELSFVLAITLLSACSHAVRPLATAQSPVESSHKIVHQLNYQITAFNGEGKVTIFHGYKFQWSAIGMEILNEKMEAFPFISFEEYKVLCLSALNPSFGLPTGTQDCRTSNLVGPNAGEADFNIAQSVFDAMGMKEIRLWELTNTGTYVGTFYNKEGNPIEGGTLRSSFLMFNKNNKVQIFTSKGILTKFPQGSAQMCISLNDKIHPDGIPECVPLGGEGE